MRWRARRVGAPAACHVGGAAVLDLVLDPGLRWINILQRPHGLLNQALLWLGFIDQPTTWLATDTAVYIGLTYSYFLPFCCSTRASKSSTKPCSKPPPISVVRGGRRSSSSRFRLRCRASAPGAVVLHSDRGEFATSDLLGGSDAPMIGQTLRTEFSANRPVRVGRRRWSCSWWRRSRSTSACRRAPDRGAPMRRLSFTNLVALALGLRPDRDPHRLFVQCLAAGDPVRRLVDALVRGAARRSRHDRRGARLARRCKHLGGACDVLGTMAALA